MVRKRVGTGSILVLAGAASAAGVSVAGCSSSSSSASAGGDAGSDGHTSTRADAGADASKKGHDAGTGGPKAVDAGPGGPVARFVLGTSGTPNLLDVPFPTDLYRTSAGTLLDPIPGASTVISSNSQFITHELGKKNGFSRVAASIFYVDDPSQSGDGAADGMGIATIDPTSLPASEAACVADTSSVFLLDLSATGAAARIPCRAGFHDDRFLGAGGFRPNVAVGPGRGVLLQEGHQYATVLTSRVKTTQGKAVGASPDFVALSGPTSKSSLYGTALTKANAILGSALGTDTIVDLAVFTTSTETNVLVKMRTNLESVAVPPLAWDAASLAPMAQGPNGTAVKFAAPVDGSLPAGFTATLDDYLGTVTAPQVNGVDDPNTDLPVRAHDKIAAIGTAVFQAENYLSPSLDYAVLDGATFSYDANGNVIPNAAKPTAPIWVTFFVPTAPMPATGYPVVIVQHGLGESRADEAFDLANTFAAAGWMVAAIDSVTFGARASEHALQVDKVNNFASGGGGYSGPDGLADAPTNGLDDLFGALLDLGAIRDQFRQAAIDTSQLARVLHSNPSLTALQTGATAPAIDPTRIAYFGNSLGGIEGAAAAAIEPLIKNWVLNVAGGGLLLELAAHSPDVSPELAFAGLNFGATHDHLNETHPLINFIQNIVDPGDPLDYGPYVVQAPATVNGAVNAPKNVLQIEVVYDEYVPNESNEALARAMGIHLATPNVGTNSGVSTPGMVINPATIPDRLPLTDQNPDDAGLIHDTPVTGTTAVLVQTLPGVHGNDFLSGLNTHHYAVPYNQFTQTTPFVQLGTGAYTSDPPFQITCAYLQLQAMAVRFLSDGFANNVPNVTGIPAPVRDFDGDGYDDTLDSDSNDPNVH